MVDTTKKSNRKCEHCKNWIDKNHCGLNGQPKNYWNCCKKFEWHPRHLVVGTAEEKLKRLLTKEERQLESMRKIVYNLRRNLDEAEAAYTQQYDKVVELRKDLEKAKATSPKKSD